MIKEVNSAHLGVAVLSPHFVVKDWPMEELQLMLSDTVRTCEGRFFPLFYKVLVLTATSAMLCRAPVPACSEVGLHGAGQRARLRGH